MRSSSLSRSGGVRLALDRLRSLGRRRLRRRPPNGFVENRREARRHVARAGTARDAQRLREAESLAVRAILAAPSWIEGYRALGFVLDAEGRREPALECHRGILPEAICDAHLTRPCPPTAEPVPPGRTVVFEAERHELPAPGGVAPATPGAHEREALVARAAHVDRVPGGRLWQDAHNTLVLDGHGHAVPEHTLGNERLARHLGAGREPLHLGARAIVLGARGSGNYYHWMTDVLPKLELCRRAGYRFSGDDRFVLPSYRAAFQLRGLALFGIEERQVHFTNRSTPWVSAEELIVPSLHNAMGTTMGSWLPRFLKDAFLGPGEHPAGTRRLFVARDPRRSQGREVTNIAEIGAWFVSRGFELVHPETLPVDEQARLFAEASVVAAPHGAGLTNIVFCAPGTHVIEFHGAHLAPCYRAISALAGLRYHVHDCHGTVPEQDEHARARSLSERRTAGFPIDVEIARALLDSAGIP